MRRQASGGETWPLTSPLDNPIFVPGGAIRFDLNDVPPVSPTGPLANYIPAVRLKISGALAQAETGGTNVPWWDIPRLLIKNIELSNAWHGTPVSSSHVLGEIFRNIEFIGGGFRYGQQWSPELPAGSTNAFEIELRIPLSAGQDSLLSETSQLALLYQPSSLFVQFKDASVLNAFSAGATWVGLNARCSAELDPRQEIVLGIGVEWILHRQVATAQGSEVQIKGFGRDSKMSGVLPKGGVMTLIELTNIAGQLGALVDAHDIKEYSNDWRGQKITKHTSAVFESLRDQLPDAPPLIPVAGTVSPDDRMNWPFYNGAAGAGAGAAQWQTLPSNVLGWLMVLEGTKCRLTDLQTADRDETYHLDPGATGFNPDNEHRILAQYARQWTEGKRADFFAQVTKGGAGSVAATVLGRSTFNLASDLAPRGVTDKHTLTGDQVAYLPWQLT
jgi:hypothetical protein